MPQQEKKWLYYALEFLKNVSHPVVISDLIGDTKVSELYRREEFPLEDKRHFSTEEDRLYYNFSNLGKLQKRQVAQNTSNLDIIKMLIKVARGKAGVRDKAWPILFINLAKNPNIFKEDLYKELLENVKNYADNDGYTANGQDLVFRVLSILLDSPYAKEEDLDFIEDFKEDFDEGRS